MKRRVIFMVKEYLCDLPEPNRYWPKYEFQKRSYERFAVKEILSLIDRQRTRSVSDIVKEFARKMRMYESMDHEANGDRFIFSVAKDVANDILAIVEDIEEGEKV